MVVAVLKRLGEVKDYTCGQPKFTPVTRRSAKVDVVVSYIPCASICNHPHLHVAIFSACTAGSTACPCTSSSPHLHSGHWSGTYRTWKFFWQCSREASSYTGVILGILSASKHWWPVEALPVCRSLLVYPHHMINAHECTRLLSCCEVPPATGFTGHPLSCVQVHPFTWPLEEGWFPEQTEKSNGAASCGSWWIGHRTSERAEWQGLTPLTLTMIPPISLARPAVMSVCL